VEKLRKHFLRTLQPFRLTTQTVNDSIRIVQTLDFALRKCADLIAPRFMGVSTS
jgi:hypothetical protein